MRRTPRWLNVLAVGVGMFIATYYAIQQGWFL